MHSTIIALSKIWGPIPAVSKKDRSTTMDRGHHKFKFSRSRGVLSSDIINASVEVLTYFILDYS